MNHINRFRVKPGEKVRLKDISTKEDGGMSEEEARDKLSELKMRMDERQEVLYAQASHALLVVLQAMDTGGKDSTIRSVFTGFNPAGCRVVSFKSPNEAERHHDFLWRVHERTPRLGYITVFNRSHYEDVLIVRVHGLAPEKRWRARYEHINHFEEMLHDEGTRIVKIFLHISREYQKERLLKRLAKSDKLWKFDPNDVKERKSWKEYQAAYEDVLERCSTEHAPWFVIPAETRWYRDVLVASAIVEALEAMDLEYPKPGFDPKEIVID